ncbi:hypothetical protein HanRHA438_Chr13g0595661 [Helianthus annuus]|nr:hypothetical protein HanRHA438_Chr13g0595661 [Helianthus annuus]
MKLFMNGKRNKILTLNRRQNNFQESSQRIMIQVQALHTNHYRGSLMIQVQVND